MTSLDTASRIRLAAILGTSRPGNYTAQALALVLDELKRHGDVHVDVIDPSTLSLPFPGTGKAGSAVREVQERVRGATGVIIATPEYHGTYPALLKLVIENLGFPSALSGKPVALLGVAAGQIGAIKSLEHLRSVCSHVGAIVLPGPVSVARVQTVFDDQGHCTDAKVERSVRAVASNLLEYIQDAICPETALEHAVRASG
jgi:NAD(P)H-dependent FMN reductase